MSNFSQIGSSLKSPACPKDISLVLAFWARDHSPKNEEKNEKNTLTYLPKDKCAKFQQNRTIFEVFSVAQSF